MEQLKKRFAELPGENKLILTTEKDAMRLQSKALETYLHDLPLYYLPISVKFVQEENSFNQLILDYVRSFKTNH